MNEEPDKLEQNWRNPDGTLKPGHPPMGGRPKGKGLKEYDREKFAKMTDEEKEAFLNLISPEIRYKMAEGNPHQASDIDLSYRPTPLDDVHKNESIQEDKETDQTD